MEEADETGEHSQLDTDSNRSYRVKLQAMVDQFTPFVGEIYLGHIHSKEGEVSEIEAICQRQTKLEGVMDFSTSRNLEAA